MSRSYKVYCTIVPIRERCVNSVVYELGKVNAPSEPDEVLYTVSEHKLLEGGGSFLGTIHFFVDKNKATLYYEGKTSEPIMCTDLVTKKERTFT